MMFHTRYIVTLLAIALISVSSLKGDDFGGYPGSYLQLSVVPRAASLGNAFTAVSDDASAVFFNPAAAALVQKITITGGYRDMSLDRSLQQLVVLLPVQGEAAIGFSAEMASMGSIVGRASNGAITEDLDHLEAVISITFARRFSPLVALGGNIRYYQQKLQSTSAYSAGFDVGGMLFLDKEEILPVNGPIDLIRFGAVVRNIAAKYPWSTGDYWGEQGELGTDITEKVPLVVKLGTSVLAFDRTFLLAVDGVVEEHKDIKINVGGEYTLLNTVALRAGLSAGRPAFGAGFIMPVGELTGRIDIAVEESLNIGGWESIFGFSVAF